MIRPFIFPKLFAYKETNVHCWVTAPDNSEDKEALMILAVFIFEIIPVFIGAVVTLYFYYRAVKIANDSVGAFVSRQFNSYHLFWYPFVLFVVFVFSIIDDLGTAQGKEGIKVIELLHILLTHSIGFINAILYGFQKKAIFARNQVLFFWEKFVVLTFSRPFYFKPFEDHVFLERIFVLFSQLFIFT